MEQRWKRWTSGLLCLMVVLSVLAVSAMAQSVVADGVCGEGVSWRLTEAGELIVSGSGVMDDYDLTTNKVPWYDHRKDIKKVVVESGVTGIGNYAFGYCSNLTDVRLSEGVRSIGRAAFYYCSELTDLSLPEGLVSIGGSAFGYSGLTGITIPGSVTDIGTGAFADCEDLQGIWVDSENRSYRNDDWGVLFDIDLTVALQAPGAITGAYRLPESVTAIGDRAFTSCSGLTAVILPEGLDRIGDSAFSHCTGLTGAHLPESLTSLGDSAFYCCIALAGVVVPEGVTQIGDWTFGHCYDLASVILPEGVTDIGRYAFYNCYQLPYVVLPKTVTIIYEYAFESCNVLADVYYGGTEAQWTCVAINDPNEPLLAARLHFGEKLPHDLVEEGVAPTCTEQGYTDQICTGCGASFKKDYVDELGHTYHVQVDGSGDHTRYTCLVCGDSYEEQGGIGDEIFYDSCGEGVSWRLTDAGVLVIFGQGQMDEYDDPSSVPWNGYRDDIVSVVVAPGVTGIGSYAFYGHTALTSVALPEGLTSIGYDAFCGCTELISISLPEGLTDLGSGAFAGCDRLTEVILPEGLTRIESYLFDSCSSLISVSLPAGVTDIGSYAFAYCSSLTTVEFPEELFSIGDYAFTYCSSLTDVWILRDVAEIGEKAFSDCTALQEFWVDPENAYYSADGYGVLFDKEKTVLLQAPGAITGEYGLPESVTRIEDHAFAGCAGLTGVELPAGVTEIGMYAFDSCASLTGVSLPEGLDRIESGVFYYCSSLATISLPDGLTHIGNNAFEGCSSLTGVTIPKSVTTIYSGAFLRCEALEGIWVDPENSKFCSDGYGVLFDKEMTKLIQAPGAIAGAYSVPQGVETIGYKAFAYCRALTGVTLPKGLTKIDTWAFAECDSLTDVTVPEGVTGIGDSAFYDCDVLYSVVLSEGLIRIDGWMFARCRSLVSVTLPEGVTQIGTYAFYACDKLADVYFGGTEEQWDAISIGSNNAPLTRATIHFGVCSHSYTAETVAPGCLEQGYTVYTCARCGDSYTDDYVAATGHSYGDWVLGTVPGCDTEGEMVRTCTGCQDRQTRALGALGHEYQDGKCTVCGAADPDAVTDPGLTLSYPTLSFEDEIIYNVYFSVKDTTSIVEMGLMILPKMDQNATVEDATALVPGYVTNGVAYLAKSEGVPAANMGDTLYFKVYAKLTDGSYAYSSAGGYNAKAYADSILSSDNDASMKALVVSMLNYGAEAQLFFGHDTDKLVNSFLTDAHKASIHSYDSTMMDPIVKADSAKTTDFVRVNSNFRSLYPSVSFDGAFAINFYCQPAIVVDGSMTMYYWDMETMEGVEKLSTDNATGSMVMESTNGMYWGQVAGIAAKEMDKTYYVSCVFESNGETITTGVIPYSLGKYCSDKAAADGDAQQSFAQATAVYGYYAKAYFASIA